MDPDPNRKHCALYTGKVHPIKGMKAQGRSKLMIQSLDHPACNEFL